MRGFILLDLATQMPYLPSNMRAWPRERILSWLRLWGRVSAITPSRDDKMTPELRSFYADAFGFESWAGLSTLFLLTEAGEMRIPFSRIRAWPSEHR